MTPKDNTPATPSLKLDEEGLEAASNFLYAELEGRLGTSPERITVWRCLKCGDVGRNPEQTCWVRHANQGRGGYEDHGGRKPIQALLLPSSEAEEHRAVELAEQEVLTAAVEELSWNEPYASEAAVLARAALKSVGFLKDEG